MRLILIIVVLSTLIQLILPWWSLAIITFCCCYWQGQGAGKSFIQAFIAIALVWLVYALIIHFNTGGVLTGRMSSLILKWPSAIGMLMLTPILGGLVGGFSGLAGYFVRQAILPSQQFVAKKA